MDNFNAEMQDALTHGLYVSEVRDEVKADYAAYVRSLYRADLVDIPVGAP